MEVTCLLLLALLPGHGRGQGVYAPAQAQIVHAGQACVVKEDNISERVYTIREGDTLVLQCLVTGHPRPQVRWTKTAGSASDKFQETSVFNETLRIERVARTQGGRYYCKAENGVGVPAIKSIRVDVQYLDEPVLTVHQTVSDVRGSFYQEKTVFLRCTVNSNPPARFIWKRGAETLSHSQDNGVDIYEPLYTQGETKVLKLKNLRPQDYASYTCQVSVRKVCGIPDRASTFRLTNTTAPPALKLSVNETLVVNPGDNVTIVCSLTAGDPVPQLIWSHAPGPMPPSILHQGGTLSIPGARPGDSGYYNCTAINNVGNPAKKTVNLLVRSLRNATFQITPDVIKESESIQLGQDLKLSCHVDAVPQERVSYQWFKNGKAARVTDRLLVTRNDPELPPVTSSLEIIDLRFSDYGTYLCVASFQGAPVPDLSVEVNISSETVPPTISVPKGLAVVTVREGSRAELQCEVRGKPRPPVLWSRTDKEAALPSGAAVVETPDGKLRLDSVSRDMSGTYRCQTARYNGFNIRPREAQVQLNVQSVCLAPQSPRWWSRAPRTCGRAWAGPWRCAAPCSRAAPCAWPPPYGASTGGCWPGLHPRPRTSPSSGWTPSPATAAAATSAASPTTWAWPPASSRSPPKALQKLLVRAAVDAEGARCRGPHLELPAGRQAAEPAEHGDAAHPGAAGGEGAAAGVRAGRPQGAPQLRSAAHPHHQLRGRGRGRPHHPLPGANQLSEPVRQHLSLRGRQDLRLHPGPGGQLRLDAAERSDPEPQTLPQHGAPHGYQRHPGRLLYVHRGLTATGAGRPGPPGQPRLQRERQILLRLLLLPHVRQAHWAEGLEEHHG
ncbi:MAM domain-containing glycosylphosphatidylinositol anchor protein 1 isoform X3 [Ornithorhynchus anatinus]|uniref:MAM domain-containing glycosylphosphatidylinositol anchor protein 1 isoform X3 n=1 Tax=Ornithorhynchus anatinus TaxID=9258 RepID=UPI0019D44A15|nr:MAM domain-containing glycosylphosphatidylinositol anchor protein 1 isoform X3 [Ornithorhynchus anatinus]